MKPTVWATTTKLSFTLLSKPEENTLRKEWISVGVTFGDPRRNCSGSGICQIMGAGQLKHPNCKGSRVNGFLKWVDKQHLQVIFDGRLLSFQEKKRHFTDAKMPLRANISLPLEITKALGISGKAIITAGAYLIHRDGYYFHHYVRFKNVYKGI